MPRELLIDSEQEIDAEWVARCLDADPAQIESTEITAAWDTPVSRVARVGVLWRATDAGERSAATPVADTADTPRSLFVKFPKKDSPPQILSTFRREVTMYRDPAYRLTPNVLPLCYAAEFDESDDRFVIALEDLSETHFQSEWPLPPAIENCRMAVRSLARLHAHWWDHPQLEQKTEPFAPRGQHAAAVAVFCELTERFISALGDSLSPHRAQVIRDICAKPRVLLDRMSARTNVTLVHRDAHLWNFLFPRDSAGQVRMIDWQLYGNGFGANDLAYMIALFWHPERRERYEQELLRLYHSTLTEHGVTGYGYDDLETDYRIGVIRCIGVPVEQWNLKLWPAIWAVHIERIFCAYDDLECAALL
jgi:hypothetical protein